MEAMNKVRANGQNKIAIVGSGDIGHNDGIRCVLPLAQSYLRESDPSTYTVGTFKAGGVHESALRVTRALGARAIQFHSVDAFFRWRPDEAFIFWNGRSNGCQALAARLRSAGIPYTLFLLEKNEVRLMGRVSSRQPRKRE